MHTLGKQLHSHHAGLGFPALPGRTVPEPSKIMREVVFIEGSTVRKPFTLGPQSYPEMLA